MTLATLSNLNVSLFEFVYNIFQTRLFYILVTYGKFPQQLEKKRTEKKLF